MDSDKPEATRQTLELCEAWILRATEYETRTGKNGHQKDSKDNVIFKAISGGIGHVSSLQGAAMQAGKKAVGLAASQASNDAAGLAASQASNDAAGFAASRAGKDVGVARGHMDPCWVCGEPHASVDCVGWQRIIEMSLAQRDRRPTADRSQAPLARDVGCRLGAGVEVTDVPGDGDCLFHAVALGIYCATGLSFARDGLSGGVRLRARMLRFVGRSADVSIDGMTVQEWIRACHHETLDEYRARMREARGRRTRGGLLEIIFLIHAVSSHRALTAAVMHRRHDSWAVYAATGPADAPGFAVAWTGNHWMYAQLSRACWEQVAAWRARQ